MDDVTNDGFRIMFYNINSIGFVIPNKSAKRLKLRDLISALSQCNS